MHHNICIEGIDRKPRYLTIGNHQKVMENDLSKAGEIAENATSIVWPAFERNDVRIR